MNVSITETVIRQQLLGMHSERFEIGVLKTHGKMTLRENQSIDRICKSISWLRRENACDAHIFIRPPRRRKDEAIVGSVLFSECDPSCLWRIVDFA
jgi:hypothetical protein